MHGRDCHTLRINRHNIDEIVKDCSHPDILREIFTRAWSLAVGRITIEELLAFCDEQPCLLWQPTDTDKIGILVNVARSNDPVTIVPTRLVWSFIRIDESPLRGHEELQHACKHNGTPNTHYGTCLNPAHLLRGNQKQRMLLARVRKTMRKAGYKEIAA